jgi:hypothetical protein
VKRVLLAFAVLTPAAFFMPAPSFLGSAAVAATPTPAALQYVEIQRSGLGLSTPPPPGTFRSDYQAVIAAGGNITLEELRKRMMAKRTAIGSPAQRIMPIRNATRYTYYKGWIRTDDLIAQKATIAKCQQHQYIRLDLTKKTYTIQNTQPPCPTTQTPMHIAQASADIRQAQPGSADMTLSGTLSDLGPLTLDGISTTGANYDLTMQTANATGSCQDGQVRTFETKYVSQIRVPRTYCPLPETIASVGVILGGAGCDPRVHVSGTLSGYSDAGRLLMYWLEFPLTPAGFSVVIERGDVRWLSGAAANALFTVPPGFTQSA